MAERKDSGSSSKPRRVPNPVHLSEDEADVIVSERRIRKEGEGVSLEKYLQKHGLTMERIAGSRRRTRA